MFGKEQFGFEQANIFQDELRSRFREIAKFPFRFQAVDIIRPGYRRCVHRSYSIYFRIEENDISIMRILKKQDVFKAFPKDLGVRELQIKNLIPHWVIQAR